MIFEQLNQFRQNLYRQMGKAKDAMFDLMDAVLVSASIASFVSLSQNPVSYSVGTILVVKAEELTRQGFWGDIFLYL